MSGRHVRIDREQLDTVNIETCLRSLAIKGGRKMGAVAGRVCGVK